MSKPDTQKHDLGSLLSLPPMFAPPPSPFLPAYGKDALCAARELRPEGLAKPPAAGAGAAVERARQAAGPRSRWSLQRHETMENILQGRSKSALRCETKEPV